MARWGLPRDAVDALPERLHAFWQRYRQHFWTKTRNVAEYAYHYLSGLLRMKTDRNFAEIGRQTGVAGENLHHFMSNSPWSAQGPLHQVRQEIKVLPEWQHGSVLILDESAVAKAGDHPAGSARQHNGRLGKTDRCQVGVFLALGQGPNWTWIDGELFLPEVWFGEAYAERRAQAEIPIARTFKTKVELGWEMIARALDEGVPFDFVACDDLYGRANWFRAQLAARGVVYMADVPSTTRVYLQRPEWGVPSAPKRGKAPTQPRVLSPEKPLSVAEIAARPETQWHTLAVRSTARGELQGTYAARCVWTLRDGVPTEEWLVMRRAADGEVTYAFSNASADTSLETLAYMEAQRYFVERTIQDAKSELGWDECQAFKYRAWEHHLALTIMAAWFITQTRLEWQAHYAADPQVQELLEVDELPVLSVANVRELLRATMPLRQLSIAQAQELIAQHLLNRARSRKSRLKKQRGQRQSSSSEHE